MICSYMCHSCSKYRHIPAKKNYIETRISFSEHFQHRTEYRTVSHRMYFSEKFIKRTEDERCETMHRPAADAAGSADRMQARKPPQRGCQNRQTDRSDRMRRGKKHQFSRQTEGIVRGEPRFPYQRADCGDSRHRRTADTQRRNGRPDGFARLCPATDGYRSGIQTGKGRSRTRHPALRKTERIGKRLRQGRIRPPADNGEVQCAPQCPRRHAPARSPHRHRRPAA